MDDELTAVFDPDDNNVCYWVAWREEDNPNTYRNPKLYRVFRDERIKERAEPISAPMSREEAYRELRRLKVLIGGMEP